ncbi:MAG: hypothetical protein H7125_00375 [Proteobacteria bacterium]|nr:hypothetical protein [Burkholderiales bacterium]
MSQLPIMVIEHPFGARSREEIGAIAERLVDELVAGAVAHGDGGARTASNVDAQAARLELPADAWAFHRECLRRRWSDGLPMIPPTPERVARMLAASGQRADTVLASLAPAFGVTTLERVAINAVMAGCAPEHLPVLIAAIAAVADPAFNLQAVQTTTNPVTTWLIVNGPIVEELGINGAGNCLGQGNAANATIGRALRLVLQNIGGALPGDMDRASHGQPGKFLFCCAENEAQSPWPALHVERGLAAGDSAVTVVGASGTLNLNTHSKDADELLACIACSMAFPASNDYHYCGEPWLILSPEHAAVLAGAGYDKQAVKQRLWAQSTMPAGHFARRDYERTANARRAEFPNFSPDTEVPLARDASAIGIVVAGGPGTHSVYVPTFGETRAVTRRIDPPDRRGD